MSEFRKDFFVNRWALISPERGERSHSEPEKGEYSQDKKNCPFCEGNERMTPPEVDSIRKYGKENQPGWLVRVVPNKFPGVREDNLIESIEENDYRRISGYGFHEVLIETPDHDKNIFSMNSKEIQNILDMYLKRYRAHKNDGNVRYISIFKNHGKEAGASLVHSHSQIIALPLIPPLIMDRIQTLSQIDDLYGEVMNKAIDDSRVLFSEEYFLVFAPYASIVPYHLKILAKNREDRFENTKEEVVNSLSAIIRNIFRCYKNLLGEIQFNYFLNTSPFITEEVSTGWEIEIMPKLSYVAGFERSSGIFVNPVPPEEAVVELKNAG